jgi:hypothetical protein
MKKLSLFFAFCILTVALINAQVPPQGFNYSGVARNSNGQPIASTQIGVQISLLKSSATGTLVYSENHVVNTDAFGLFNLIIGGGSIQSGSMANIAWNSDNFFVKVGLDVSGGSNFLDMGTTQLLSVPYAMHAKTAESIVGSGSNLGKTHVEIYGNITNAQADSIIAADLGQNTRFIYIMNTTQLTSLNLGAAINLIDLKITDNTSLTSLSFPNLNRCIYYFTLANNPQLNTIDINNLTSLGFVEIVENGLQQLNMPNLNVSKSFYINKNPNLEGVSFPLLNRVSGELQINKNNNLTSLNLNSLVSTQSISLDENAFSNLSFPQLSSIGSYLSIYQNPNLLSVSLNALNILRNLNVNDNPLLNNITFASNPTYFTNSSFSGNNFPSSEVNEILAILVELGTTGIAPGACFNLSYQNPPAPPTGQGITDLNTLQIVWGICIATD